MFSAEDAKQLNILDRTIKIDVQNDKMTLDADTKLVEDALETIKLVGATGVDSPRVSRNEEQTAQTENSEILTPAESTSYRSLVMKLACVAQDIAMTPKPRFSNLLHIISTFSKFFFFFNNEKFGESELEAY